MKQKITYTEKNGVLYPNLELPKQKKVTIGRFGQKHKRYLKKYRKLEYLRLLTSGALQSYLLDIDNQAQDMFEQIVNDSKEVRGITEDLKAADPMTWRQEINSIINMAEEFVLNEIVYV